MFTLLHLFVRVYLCLPMFFVFILRLHKFNCFPLCTRVYVCLCKITYVNPMFTHVYLLLPLFACASLPVLTYVYSRLPVYQCLLMHVYLCLPVYSFYLCVLVFTFVYHCLLFLVYTCLPMFTYVYLCLLVFTYVYTYLTLFIRVYVCLSMLTL